MGDKDSKDGDRAVNKAGETATNKAFAISQKSKGDDGREGSNDKKMTCTVKPGLKGDAADTEEQKEQKRRHSDSERCESTGWNCLNSNFNEEKRGPPAAG